MRSWFVTKSVEKLRAEAEQTNGLKRVLGAWDLTLLGIGAIIGTGIFVLTGHAAAVNAGPAVSLSFIISGVASVFAALCYSEMASMIPISGSAYTYTYATMGEFIAWLIGWDLILEYLVSAATVSVGWSGYLTAFVEHVTGYTMPMQWTSAPIAFNEHSNSFELTGAIFNLPAVFIVALISIILVVGVRESAKLNAGVVLIKITVVLLFLMAAAPYVLPENWIPFIPENQGRFGRFGWSGVFQGATMVFFAYIGFDGVSTLAQEAKRPQRDMPIGILASLGVCMVLYIAVSLVLTGVVHYTKLSVPHPIALGIQATGIGWLETVIEIGALAGLSTVILVTLMGQPRIFYAMSRDGLLPKAAGKIHPRFGTPHVSTIISGIVCAIAGGILPIHVLGELTSIGTLFAFLLVCLGVMILRLKKPEIPRAFRVPFGPYVVPLCGVASSLVLMYTATTHTIIRLFAWMAVGILIYLFYGRHHSKLRNAAKEESPRPNISTARVATVSYTSHQS